MSSPAAVINSLSDAHMGALCGLRSRAELQAVRELWVEWAQAEADAGRSWKGWIKSWWMFSRSPAALQAPGAEGRLT